MAPLLANAPKSNRFQLSALIPPRLPSIVGDGAWALAAKVISQAVQLAAFIAAARLLSLEQFGFYAYSSAIAILLVVCAEGGWGEFVMKTGAAGDELDQVATLSVLSGTLVTTIGFGVAAVVAFPLHQVWESTLIAFYSCWFLPSSLSTVYDGILVARGMLRKQAFIRIVAEICGLLVTIIGLWSGWNVMSLIAGRLAMQMTSLIITALVLRWRPKLYLTWPFMIEVLNFSRHILANRLIFFLRSYSGTLALGSFLGLAEAGYYRAAERIVAAASELIGEPARMLAWTVFRQAVAQSDAENVAKNVGAAATTFMMLLMVISAPVYLGLALVSTGLVDIALGDDWAPAAVLVAILAIKHVLVVPGLVTEPLLSLTGHIRKMPRAILLNGAVCIGLIVVLAPFGATATALGQCAAALVSFLISTRLQRRYGGLAWNRVLANCAYVAVAIAAMSATVYLLGYVAEVSAMKRLSSIALQVVAGGAIYVGALLVLHRVNGGLIPISVVSRN
ncbi:oligosaccharide flippase family protein [Rhizobium mongolense]|uniref:O-antigen/teichoic acid export membrane protein n=2 Tax=Rhizobium mongolense TaxID=57676 RepID=A0ABR6IVP2_9HYPH|nr:oligosaccharide flippase family protein [Rhizobium mongolense]MBB4231983.1 O-antigen/teichoic acid export membrane protein [Rhizobium mongolense]TVZ66931.1 O-antigen/teichoic acid export membrane protein [Rhizobium mongolense USDA 1844]